MIGYNRKVKILNIFRRNVTRKIFIPKVLPKITPLSKKTTDPVTTDHSNIQQNLHGSHPYSPLKSYLSGQY